MPCPFESGNRVGVRSSEGQWRGANIDAGKEPGYETVAAEIKVAVETLAAIKSVTTEATLPTE